MRTRKEAVLHILNTKTKEEIIGKKIGRFGYPQHYGLIELRHLMDFIYEGEPTCNEERLRKLP